MEYIVPNDIEKLLPENDEGNIEYKYHLMHLDTETFNKRVTQMKFRINEGCGEAIYFIGIMDDGTPLGLSKDEYEESVANLNKIANRLKYNVILINQTITPNRNDECKIHKENYVGEFLIREQINNKYIDIKISVAGNVDAGKSTTIGTLLRGINDNGRGSARIAVFNFKHEIDSGRTSSIGHQIIGFNADGVLVNDKFRSDKPLSWEEIVQKSNKIITFYDMAGHEKYLRTTIYGITSLFPDYCLILVGANMGINHMTKEHIYLCLAMKIPFIIIVSKIDIVKKSTESTSIVLEETLDGIYKLCKSGARKVPYLVNNKMDVINAIKNIKSDSIVPILKLSNKTGEGLDLLKFMLNLLPVINDYCEFINKPVELLIDNTYTVTGHPTIVSGLLKAGTININDNLAIGPFSDGSYKQTKVKSVHCKYCNIKQAHAGLYICISLKNITRNEIKKGMVVVSDIPSSKIAIKTFWAFIHLLHSPTTIKVGYHPFIHIEQVRQSVKIIEIRKLDSTTEILDDVLRTNDKANVKLEFLVKPEYIKQDMRLIFRESKVKAIGKIIADQ